MSAHIYLDVKNRVDCTGYMLSVSHHISVLIIRSIYFPEFSTRDPGFKSDTQQNPPTHHNFKGKIEQTQSLNKKMYILR